MSELANTTKEERGNWTDYIKSDGPFFGSSFIARLIADVDRLEARVAELEAVNETLADANMQYCLDIAELSEDTTTPGGRE